MHHVMFDVDGTLVKSYDFDEECFISAVFQILGHKIDSNWDNYEHASDTAILKLESAGIDVTGVPIASSNDHYERIEIMKAAEKRARICTTQPVTYFGDAAWDQKACDELGYSFVLVGDRIQHDKSVKDLKHKNEILSLIGV